MSSLPKRNGTAPKPISETRQSLEALLTMAEENLLRIDVEKRTTRGRVCPQCGGKIIPSNRAVYQSGTDANGAFPIWQCERCGYEEMSERTAPIGKTKH